MPAIVNRNACALFEEFLVSVVAGDDIVPRMHLHSLELLREDVGRLLENCNTPKYRVFASAVKSYYRNKNITTSNPANPAGLDKVELEKIRKFALSIPKQLRIGNQAHFIHIIRGSSPPLFIPGRILYLEKLRNQESAKEDDSKINQQQSESRLKRGSRSIARFISAVKERLIIMSHKPVDFKYTYVPRWADKEEFQEIKVSRSMIRDHTIIFGIFREWQEYENCQVLKAFS